MAERNFKKIFKERLAERFPGCYILNNNANDIQGIPDLLVLHHNRWAALEVKDYESAARQVNQEWYVDDLNKMSFAAFVYPENMEEILDAMEHAFQH